MRTLFVPLLLLLCGCAYVFPDPRGERPKPSPDTVIVIDDKGHISTKCPAVAASKQLAADRAAFWGEIVDQVKAGKMKSIADVESYSSRHDDQARDKFNQTVATWLEQQLSATDDTLPANAVDVFSGLRDSLREASK